MGNKCYVVTTLYEDYDDKYAETKVIKVFKSKEKAEQLVLQMKDEIIDDLTESGLGCEDYEIDDNLKNGYIIISNEFGATTIEYNESEVEL